MEHALDIIQIVINLATLVVLVIAYKELKKYDKKN